MDLSGVNATELLTRVGYFRLSGYWHPFRDLTPCPAGGNGSAPRFLPGTTLRQIESIYEFDRELRFRVFDAIETIESALRFQLGYHLGRIGMLAHRDPRNFANGFVEAAGPRSHMHTVRRIDAAEARSHEDFVTHFRRKYGGPLPVWMAPEIMSFGELIQFYQGLNTSLKNTIAAEFGIRNAAQLGDGATLTTWLNHLRHVRNICAHHSRLWNRALTTPIGLPRQIPALTHLTEARTRSRIYAAITLLRFILATIKPASTWAEEIIAFVVERTIASRLDISTLGFPVAWSTQPIWATSFVREHAEMNQHGELLGRLPSVSRSAVRTLLFPKNNPSTQKSLIRALIVQGKLLSLPTGAQQAFPTFQFVAESSLFQDRVFSINLGLIGQTVSIDECERRSWIAARWWVTPGRYGETPLEALRARTLRAAPWSEFPRPSAGR